MSSKDNCNHKGGPCKIMQKFFQGHAYYKNRNKMSQDPSVKFIPQTLTSNLKAEFTVLANEWQTLREGGGLGGLKKSCTK